ERMKGGAKLGLKYRKHTNFHREEKVMQTSEDVIAAEGDTVTLDCTFESSYSTTQLNFYWYKQEVNDFPQYILIRGAYGSNAPEFQKERFDAQVDNKKVPLKISSAAVTDSAVYYCAVRPTVTANSKTLYKNLWSKDNRKLHNIH
uniref:Ig-like domain-containing protein n=1 Tax=Amphiprion ocellaris TaxID=80972 RepID=A0AAQ5ZXC9_AMPOC